LKIEEQATLKAWLAKLPGDQHERLLLPESIRALPCGCEACPRTPKRGNGKPCSGSCHDLAVIRRGTLYRCGYCETIVGGELLSEPLLRQLEREAHQAWARADSPLLLTLELATSALPCGCTPVMVNHYVLDGPDTPAPFTVLVDSDGPVVHASCKTEIGRIRPRTSWQKEEIAGRLGHF